MKRSSLLLIAFLAAACAGGAPYEPHEARTAEPESDLEGYEARVAELQRELEASLPAPSAPPEPDQMMQDQAPAPGESDPCAVGRDLRDRICELADRICAIAQRDPSAADTQLKCQRARDACDDARSRVAGACSER